MRAVAEIVQGYVLAGCAAAMGAVIMAVAVRLLVRAAISFRRGACAGALGALALWAATVGGAKPVRVPVAFDEGLSGGAEVSADDPRTVTLRWRREAWVPPESVVTVMAVELGGSESFEVAAVPIAAGAVTVRMDMDATRYAFLVTHSYTPPPPVATNGVYRVDCFGGDGAWIPRGVTIYADGTPISWPEGTTVPSVRDGRSADGSADKEGGK